MRNAIIKAKKQIAISFANSRAEERAGNGSMSGAIGRSAEVLRPGSGISVGLPIKRFHAIGLHSLLLVIQKVSVPSKGPIGEVSHQIGTPGSEVARRQKR